MVLVPSIIDNLPQVATEAQACGRPVIGFDTGGMKDIIIDNETGYLSINKDLKSIQKNIKRLLINKLHSDSSAHQITKRANKLWSNNVINNSYTNLYNNMLRKINFMKNIERIYILTISKNYPKGLNKTIRAVNRLKTNFKLIHIKNLILILKL